MDAQSHTGLESISAEWHLPGSTPSWQFSEFRVGGVFYSWQWVKSHRTPSSTLPYTLTHHLITSHNPQGRNYCGHLLTDEETQVQVEGPLQVNHRTTPGPGLSYPLMGQGALPPAPPLPPSPCRPRSSRAASRPLLFLPCRPCSDPLRPASPLSASSCFVHSLSGASLAPACKLVGSKYSRERAETWDLGVASLPRPLSHLE